MGVLKMGLNFAIKVRVKSIIQKTKQVSPWQFFY
jgi:hypothetical protein